MLWKVISFTSSASLGCPDPNFKKMVPEILRWPIKGLISDQLRNYWARFGHPRRRDKVISSSVTDGGWPYANEP